MKKILATGLFILVGIASSVNATVIVNAGTTTDTDQGLEFLHIPEYTATSNYATALAGVTVNGASWTLATVDQFLGLMSNVTGVALAPWNGSNHNDTNFSRVQADAMMGALGYGLSSITDGPWVWLNGGSFGPAEFAAHTSCCDDFHINKTSASDINTALYVRSSVSVAEPSSFALLVMGVLGLAASRRKRG